MTLKWCDHGRILNEFVNWCDQSFLQVNVARTKEMLNVLDEKLNLMQIQMLYVKCPNLFEGSSFNVE